MKEKHAGAFFASFRKRHTEDTARQAVSLLVFQGIFLSLLLGTAILVICVNSGSRLSFYLALLFGLSALIGAALFFNLRGKYKSAAWLTTICMVLGLGSPYCWILPSWRGILCRWSILASLSSSARFCSQSARPSALRWFR
jgi:hypothetical protein